MYLGTFDKPGMDLIYFAGFHGHIDDRKVTDFLDVMENKKDEQMRSAKRTKVNHFFSCDSNLKSMTQKLYKSYD